MLPGQRSGGIANTGSQPPWLKWKEGFSWTIWLLDNDGDHSSFRQVFPAPSILPNFKSLRRIFSVGPSLEPSTSKRVSQGFAPGSGKKRPVLGGSKSRSISGSTGHMARRNSRERTGRSPFLVAPISGCEAEERAGCTGTKALPSAGRWPIYDSC